ncbi:MAG: hypothetical protein JXR73_04475 [Candidatus Omnitrophica bacterium]|nr:hypothetical protein [Candidatus Omnitrophota bacterium]
MSNDAPAAGTPERMDRFYEFDREPVRETHLHSGGRFAALFAGEYIGGADFVIGIMFVMHGVSAFDLVVGLLIGNLLAVLSWTFICAPIAVRVRTTLYWHLRKIAGPGVMVIYNLANAFLFCILAGAMISIAAAAVGIPFQMQMLSLTDFYSADWDWIMTVWGVGSVVGVVAVLGFKRMSQFSCLCAPWLLIIFIAGAVAVLPQLGKIHNLSDLWQIANTKIWDGVPKEGLEKFGLMHIIFFAWFCNLAMHIGLSDMALFRFARHWSYGFYSALGMYLGHFLVWICSGVMVSANGFAIEPGLTAFNAAGVAGVAAVVLAAWTTANPAVYRAGLALQIVSPNWPRWLTTVIAFLIATILACFPVFVLRLLDFVAVYGLILMPVGAIVFTEHWLFPRFGLPPLWAEKRKVRFNMPALLTWIIVLLMCLLPMNWLHIHLFFRWLPGWFLSIILYISFCVLWDVKQSPREGAPQL